jgi:large subunit ribosomal protein L6
MSRKGKQPIELPKNVTVTLSDGIVKVKGPKGELTDKISEAITIEQEGQTLHVKVDDSYDDARALHGLYRSLIRNMVIGASTGFVKQLEMIGVGYRAAVKGTSLDIQVGHSHPDLLPIPEGLQVEVEKNTVIKISGVDKQKVGQFAADVRSRRPPEPYQGKGIRYAGEYVRKKAGKSAGK